MIFWILAAILTFAGSLFVVIPLSKGRSRVANSIEYDKAIYKARISEIDRDLQLGRILPEAAMATKAEEARKLIALSEVEPINSPALPKKGVAFKLALLSGILLLPAGVLAVYLLIGSPQLPDQSLASRLSTSPEDQTIVELVSRAEAHLAKNPGDARGWAVLGPVYARLGRNRDAMEAWSNVYRFAPQTPEIRATLAESMVAVSQGIVTDDAKKLFVEELSQNPASAKARFYIAMALGQEGKHEQAVTAWQELIRGGSDASPWMSAAKSFLNQSAKSAGIVLAETKKSEEPGPNAEQVEAAKDLSAEDRNEMIATMVAGLAEKLKNNPQDKKGWQRLIRAYIVLGKKVEAFDTIDLAIGHHQSDRPFVSELKTLQQSLK